MLVVRVSCDLFDLNDCCATKKYHKRYGNYTSSKKSLFTINKPKCISIGFDALPDRIKKSEYLAGSHLAKLASVEKIPLAEKKNLDCSNLYQECIDKLDENNIDGAWQVVHQILKDE